MKRILVLLSMICAFVAAAPAAAERDGRYVRGDEYSRRDADKDTRYERRDQGTQDTQDAHNRDAQRRDQLSREQRDQLRRDISDYGRDIYRERRDRR